MVGSGATLATNWITSRTQRELAANDREQRRAEVRRAAYADFLVAVESFKDQARELVYRIENDVPKPECDAAQATYFAGWQDLQRTYAPVRIAGPSELAKRAEGLQYRLAALADVCDSWYTAHQNGPTRSRDGRFVSARDAANEAIDTFITAAQNTVNYDPREPAR